MAFVKTAISLRESLFERVDAVAQELDMPRSHVFVLAVEEFLQRHESLKMLEELNEVYGDAEERQEEVHKRRMREHHRKAVEGQW